MERVDLSERFLCYGASVIRLVAAMPGTLVGRRIGDQLLRSGMAVGANYEEARGAESSADFVHKLQIALKELRESNYWIRLMDRASVMPPEALAAILNESHQLRNILSKAVATAKGRAREKF